MENIVPVESITKRIFFLRGYKVMLDSALAELYGVETKVLNQAVKRNKDRFPSDFMFQLTSDETAKLSIYGIHNIHNTEPLRSQNVTLKLGKGQHRKYLPFAFTEQGVAMLSSVLRSKRAVYVNIAIMRAFVMLRGMIGTHKELAKRLDDMEKKYDLQFKVVFDAIRELMTPHYKPERRIGFRQEKI